MTEVLELEKARLEFVIADLKNKLTEANNKHDIMFIQTIQFQKDVLSQ